MTRSRNNQAEYDRVVESSRGVLLSILLDKRERTTSELRDHPKMKRFGLSSRAIASVLDHMVKEGLVIKDGIGNPAVKTWRLKKHD